VKGVPAACPKCFWLRSKRYEVISLGALTVFHSEHSFGSTVGSCGTWRRVNPLC
jgi:hypothetical protein